MRGRADWFAPLLFAHVLKRVFSAAHMETWTIDQAQIALRFGWYLFNGVLIKTHMVYFFARINTKFNRSQTDRQTDNTLFMNNNSGHTQVAYEKICNIHTLNRWRTMASLRISRTKTYNRLGWCQLLTCILYTYMKHAGVYIRVYSFLSEWNTSEVRSVRTFSGFPIWLKRRTINILIFKSRCYRKNTVYGAVMARIFLKIWRTE